MHGQFTWIKSRKRCKDTGSDLVSIESGKEWILLKEAIQMMQTTEYFIGLKMNSMSKEWRWISDNSKVNAIDGEFPRAKEEPNGDGKCAVMYKDYRNDYGEFNDLECDVIYQKSGYICESPADWNDQEGMSYNSISFIYLFIYLFIYFHIVTYKNYFRVISFLTH